MKTGIELITDERARQVSKEGWTALHDSEHTQAEMCAAAQCYAAVAEIQAANHCTTEGISDTPDQWPWDHEWWKPSDDPVRNLVKAGALIAAEIDRLQRLREHTAAIELKPGRGLADS